MKIRETIIFCLFFLFEIGLYGQSDVRLNNYWWKTSIINPAAMSKEYLAEFDLGYRNHWTLFPGAPTTMYVSGAYYIEDFHTKIGARATQDKIGYTSSTDIDILYSYATLINLSWRLQMGLSLSYQNQSYDISKINSLTPTDPALINLLLNENRLNTDLGFELTNNEWLFGISSQNVASLFREEKYRFQNTNIFYGIYRQWLNEKVSLNYGISGIMTNNIYQAEFHFSSTFKDTFQVGALYRTPNELGISFGINLSKNLILYYNYDYNVGGISRKSIGSHEIMISYNLDKIYECNCWY